jgi:hypothetical protein
MPSRPTATYTFALKARLLLRREPPHQATTAFNTPTAIDTWTEGALQQAFVAYIPVNEVFFSGFSSLVLYNQRVSGQNKNLHLQCRQRRAFERNRAGRH